MTVSVPAQLVYTYSGDGTTTAFSYPVRFTAKAEIVVSLVEDGIETPQTLTTHYTIAGGSWPTGGTVTFLTAPAVGQTVRIYRWTASKQEADLEDKQRNPVAAIELALDRLAMVGQDIGRIALDAEEGLADLDNAVAAAELAQAAAETAEANAGTAETNAETAETNARKWATEDEDVSVDDGVNPEGFSAYHWAKKSESYTGAPAAGTVADASVANPSALYNRLNDMVSVKDPQFAGGAKGDCVRLSAHANITSGDNTLTTTTFGLFTSADVGKYIEVDGAGVAGAVLRSTIAAYNGPNSVELTHAASTTVALADVTWGTDDSAAFNAALAAAPAVFVPPATYSRYLLLSPLTSDTAGQRLWGSVIGTTLMAAHAGLGPVYRWKRPNCGIEYLTIEATAYRKENGNSASINSIGLLGMSDDTTSQSVASTVIDHVIVRNQPGIGVRMVGTQQESTINYLLIQGCGLHGYMSDSGESLSRTNTQQPGQVDYHHLWCLNNAGHSLVVSHPNDTKYAYRHVFYNYECSHDALNEILGFTNHSVFMRGENHMMFVPAFGGNMLNGSRTEDVLAMHVWGNNIKVYGSRVIGCGANAINVASENAGASPSSDVEFRGFRVIACGTQNPLITVGTNGFGIKAYTENTTNITSLMTAGVPQSEVGFGVKYHVYRKAEFLDYKSIQIAIADDAVAFIEFSAVAEGGIAVNCATLSRGGIGEFRVGDGSAYASKFGGSTNLTFASATGTAPTGTTGTDNFVTVTPMNNANRLYYENRTGGTRNITSMLYNISTSAYMTGRVGTA